MNQRRLTRDQVFVPGPAQRVADLNVPEEIIFDKAGEAELKDHKDKTLATRLEELEACKKQLADATGDEEKTLLGRQIDNLEQEIAALEADLNPPDA